MAGRHVRPYKVGDRVRVKRLDGEWQLYANAMPYGWHIVPYDENAMTCTARQIQLGSDWQYKPHVRANGHVYAVTVPSHALERVW